MISIDGDKVISVIRDGLYTTKYITENGLCYDITYYKDKVDYFKYAGENWRSSDLLHVHSGRELIDEYD